MATFPYLPQNLIEKLAFLPLKQTLLSVFFLFYLSKSAESYPIWLLPCVLTLLLGLVLCPKVLSYSSYWLLQVILLLYPVYDDVYMLANHHFVLIYLCLLMAIISYPKYVAEQVPFLDTNIRYMITILFVFAGVQKLFSEDYRNGSFVAYMILKGDFFPILCCISSHWKEAVEVNQAIISNDALHHTYVSIQLKPPISQPYFGLFVRIWGLLACMGELAIGLIWLLFPQKTQLKHIALVSLLIGIMFTRQEFGFLSLVALMGMMACRKENYYFALMYLFLILLFFSFIILQVGFI